MLFTKDDQSPEDVFNRHVAKHLRKIKEELRNIGLETTTDTFNTYIEDYVRSLNENPFADVTIGDVEDLRESKTYKKAHELAMQDTIHDTYQAMEAFVHNMNSLNGSRGNQSVFSSINFGLDTSWEGRLVTRATLDAMLNGTGNGETAIYPICIFKLKSGINMKKGEPNYDLFKFAQLVTTKRLFPNYQFVDASFNIEGFDINDPSTHIATMGCFEGYNTVKVREDGKISIKPIADVWRDHNGTKQVHSGVSQYIKANNLEVMDIDGNFTKVKTIIKNEDIGNWMKVTTNDGRFIKVTDDHPFVTNRGRVQAKDLTLNDKLVHRVINENVTHDYEFDKKAWLEGLIITDASYSSNVIRISLGLDEEDLADFTMKALNDVYGLDSKKIYQDREEKGNYIDVVTVGGASICKELIELFKGTNKLDRRIPEYLVTAGNDVIASFIAGMMDGDGYIREYKNRPNTFQSTLGSTNKVLAMQQFELLEELGIKAKVSENRYKGSNDPAVRIVVSTKLPKTFGKLLKCKKKYDVLNQENYNDVQRKIETAIKSIEHLGSIGEPSFDFETESDTFVVSGIQTHNCRTRVFENIFGKNSVDGRGNASFTTINLPMVIKEHLEGTHDSKSYEDLLLDYVDLCASQLMKRFAYQKEQKVSNFKFLYKSGSFDTLGRKLNDDDKIGELMNQNALSIGFIGLAEAMMLLKPGKSYLEDEVQTEAFALVKLMESRIKELSREYNVNMSLLATPSEGYAGKSLARYVAKYGHIEGIEDHKFFTNSFHVPVWEECTAKQKIDVEAKYHALTLAGHISYIELTPEDAKDLDKVEELILYMAKSNMGYASINVPIDRCLSCGWDEPNATHTCPRCGSAQVSHIRRITGYITGTLDLWNTGKRDEEAHRVKHSL